ncbi:50S ribosomal protein L22 [Patescibacteria group bacterium]
MTKKVVAYQKFIRQTARKLRLVADMIRGMDVETALVQLKVSRKKGAEVLRKVLIQAKANAINTNLRSETLKISEILIEEGPSFKRWRPVSRGRAHSIMKRTSHIKLTLEGSDESVVKKASTKKDSKTAKTDKDIKKGK